MITYKNGRELLLILIALVCLVYVFISCVSPNAIQSKITGMDTQLESLRTVVDQQADQINNDLLTWKKHVEAQTINYDGAIWVVIGSAVIVIIFVGAGFLLVRAFIKRGTLLTFLTSAIKQLNPTTQLTVKQQLKKEIESGKFTEQTRQDLGTFAKNRGTFAEHNEVL